MIFFLPLPFPSHLDDNPEEFQLEADPAILLPDRHPRFRGKPALDSTPAVCPFPPCPPGQRHHPPHHLD